MILFMTITTNFLGCILFVVTGLFGSFPIYIMHKMYDLYHWFSRLLLSLFLDSYMKSYLISHLCCLTFLLRPLQLGMLVVPFLTKVPSTMLNTRIISSFLQLVILVVPFTISWQLKMYILQHSTILSAFKQYSCI